MVSIKCESIRLPHVAGLSLLSSYRWWSLGRPRTRNQPPETRVVFPPSEMIVQLFGLWFLLLAPKVTFCISTFPPRCPRHSMVDVVAEASQKRKKRKKQVTWGKQWHTPRKSCSWQRSRQRRTLQKSLFLTEAKQLRVHSKVWLSEIQAHNGTLLPNLVSSLLRTVFILHLCAMHNLHIMCQMKTNMQEMVLATETL